MPGPMAARHSCGRVPKADGHGMQGIGDDAARRAAPAGVREADGAMHGIDEEDGETVRRRDAEQQVGGISDEGVAAGKGGRAVHTAPSRALPGLLERQRRYEAWPVASAPRGQNRARVQTARRLARTCFGIRGGRKREIEAVRGACIPQGKTVPKPGQGAQGFGMGKQADDCAGSRVPGHRYRLRRKAGISRSSLRGSGGDGRLRLRSGLLLSGRCGRRLGGTWSGSGRRARRSEPAA